MFDGRYETKAAELGVTGPIRDTGGCPCLTSATGSTEALDALWSWVVEQVQGSRCDYAVCTFWYGGGDDASAERTEGKVAIARSHWHGVGGMRRKVLYCRDEQL